MNDTLLVNEIFFSIQGEGTRIGSPCAFVRLAGCHLRCHYCDTEYAFHDGRRRPIDAVIKQLCSNPCDLIEVTGGEPLLQPNVHTLMRRLCDGHDYEWARGCMGKHKLSGRVSAILMSPVAAVEKGEESVAAP